jgi:hypothetical protein
METGMLRKAHRREPPLPQTGQPALLGKDSECVGLSWAACHRKSSHLPLCPNPYYEAKSVSLGLWGSQSQTHALLLGR